MIEVKLPKTIKVGGFDYEVKIGEREGKELRSQGLWGRHLSDLREIQFDPEMEKQQFAQTTIHELIHAADAVYNEGEKITEVQVSHLANGLHQIFEQLGIRIVK